MSISKLRGKQTVLARQETVKSHKGCGAVTSVTTNGPISGSCGAVAGAGSEAVVRTSNNAGGANDSETHQTANVCITTTTVATTKLVPAAASTTTVTPMTMSTTTAKLLSPAAANAAVVAAATAATIAAKQQQQQQQKQQQQQQAQQPQTNLPQTSLLKIEPFIPSLNARLRRPFGRSYSTLSTMSVKRCKANTNAFATTTRITTAKAINAAAALNAPFVGATIDGSLAKSAALLTTANSRAGTRLRRNPTRVITRQRSKSTSSSASNRPTTAQPAGQQQQQQRASPKGNGTTANGGDSGGSGGAGSNVTPQPNGICRITRNAHEKDKLPDRINYDRRGLTVIPIFEQEPQLRLLSLQHNLINIFHIPKEAPVEAVDADTETSIDGLAEALKPHETSGQSWLSSCRTNGGGGNSPKQRHARVTGGMRLALPLTGSNSNLLSTGNASVCSYRTRNLTPPPVAPPSSPLGVQPMSHSLQRNGGLLPKNLHYNGQLLPLAHTRIRQVPPTVTPMPMSMSTAANSRFTVKRSKSFVTNYSRQLQQSLQQHLLRAQLSRTEPHTLGKLCGVPQLKSFDSSSSALTLTDSTCTFGSNTSNNSSSTNNNHTAPDHAAADDDLLQPLQIKNNRLVISYGNIFQNLVFLDLYDNQIERIGNLDGLPALTVLLLGKNRLTDISGLASLRQTLRVLDLHGNKIIGISNKINCLQELKSLNLAGNQIRQINHNDFNALPQLKELNLKRNKIKRIHGFQHLPALERLWLCHNDLHKVDDMASIAHAANLLEVTIENNPVSLAGDCVSFLVSHLPRLQSLSQMPITEQVRRAAMAWRKHKEISNANYSHLTPDAFNSIKREEVISNARTNWELLRSQQTLQNSLRQHQQQQQQQHLQHQQPSAKPSELGRITESNEAVVAYEELQEFIKLPPIQQQKKQQTAVKQPEQQQSAQTMKSNPTRSGKLESTPEQPNYAHDSSNGNNYNNSSNKQNDAMSSNNSNNNSNNTNGNVNGRHHSGSSGSSLGPNVDSSSSSYSSDIEDSPKLERVRLRKCSKTITQRGRARKDAQRTHNKAASARRGSGSAAKKRTQQPRSTAVLANTITAKQTTTTTKTNDSDAAASVNSNQTDNNSSTPSRITKANKTMAMMSANTAAQEATADGGNAVTPNNMPTASNSNGNAHAAQIAGNGNGGTASHTFKGQPNNGIVTLVTPQISTTEAQVQVPAHTSTSAQAPATLVHNVQPSATCGQTTVTSVNVNVATSIALTLITTATTTTTPRTTCKRLMRSQTIVGGGTHNSNNNNNSTNHLATPTNVANEVSNAAEAATATARRTHSSYAHISNNSRATTATVTSSQTQQQLGFTCIVAPTTTTLNAPTSNSAAGGKVGSNNRAAATAAAATTQSEKEREREREREQGGDYLIEICGRYLNVYGQGALRYIDKQWNATKAQDVHTLNFSYINFNNIAATVLARIKARFPNAENFVFRETNIDYLGQLNALAELQGISALTIDPEGNAITTKDLWREYAIYRLSHWGLKLLNGVAVTDTEVEAANALYEGLSDLVLWAMPASMLQPLLTRLRLDETCTASKLSPKEWLMKPENKALRLVVGKEALQWKKPNTVNSISNASSSSSSNNANSNNNNSNGCNGIQNLGANQQQMHYAVGADVPTISAANNASLSMRERGRLHFATMLENTCNAAEKLHKLETVWPTLLLDIVRNALLDFSHLDEYLRDLMNEIMQ